MITKILEAEATINGSVYKIINTDMDLSVEWDISVDKKDTRAEINVIFKRLIGSFSYQNHLNGYKKKTTITFSVDQSCFSINAPSKLLKVVEPLIAYINLDLKEIIISF
jgi:hypothetical protein